MEEFKPNQYIRTANFIKNSYWPVRILKKTNGGYIALNLKTGKNIVIYEYQLEVYGYQHIWITKELLTSLGFKNDGFVYELGNILVWEAVMGNMSIDNHSHQYNFQTNFKGYFIINKDRKIEFQKEFSEIDFNSDVSSIKEKYFSTSKVNGLFNYLIDFLPGKFNYNKFDELLKTIIGKA